MTTIMKRGRQLLPIVAVMLAAAAALPPAGTYARRYAVAQAAQFALFAVVVPALLTVGWPARWSALRERLGARHAALIRQPGLRAATTMLPFVALVIVWRLPAVLSALDRDPALTAAELVTLAGAGTAVWLELTAGPAAHRPLPLPLRASMAAVAMWTVWAVAYVTGMSATATGPARLGATLSAAADQQLAAALLWAVPGLCFVPVVYATLMGWLADRDEPDPAIAASALPGFAEDMTMRQPRGWRR